MSSKFIPTPANKLMQDAITGRATRRELIKRGSALGLSAVLMDRILLAGSVGAPRVTLVRHP